MTKSLAPLFFIHSVELMFHENEKKKTFKIVFLKVFDLAEFSFSPPVEESS